MLGVRCFGGRLRLIGKPARADGPRVILIAPHSSYRLVPYLNAARKLSTNLLIVSEGEHSLVSEVAEGVKVRFAEPSEAVSRVIEACEGYSVGAVVGSDDRTVEMAARVASHFRLPHNPPAAALLSRRKDLARQRLAGAGLPVPRHWRLDLDRPVAAQTAGIVYPCVAKPLALSGSRGVIRANDRESLVRAAARIHSITAGLDDWEESRFALVEQYIPGFEVAVEAILTRGRLHLIAIFDKPDPLEGPYFEETYYVTPSRLPAQLQRRVVRRVSEACAAYGLVEGPVHAELRIHAGEAWILEVAARTIGGECSRLLRFGAGRSLEELVLERAMGGGRPVRPEEGGAGVLMIPVPASGVLRRVEGLLAAQRVEGVEDIQINVREGYRLIPLPEGDSYVGFIFARGAAPQDAERALRVAHSHLRFVTAPFVPLTAAS